MAAIIPENTERFRYWQGQKLLSRDLRDQFATDAQMRWWHNRALHNAYGVRQGLKVTEEDGGIVVGDGVAYDCFGRELILHCSRTIARDSAGKTVLMIRYKETAEFVSHSDLLDVCAPCGTSASPNAEEPEFFWADAKTFSFRDGVPLSKLDGKENDVFIPPVSRPLARPRISKGATVPGDTAWEIWSETFRNINSKAKVIISGAVKHEVGIQVKIDTSAAGFTKTPCYFAWLQGQVWGAGIGKKTFFPIPFDHITNASINGFTFRLWLPEIPLWRSPNEFALVRSNMESVNFKFFANVEFGTNFLSYAKGQKLYVSWLGIEHGDDL